MMKNYEKWDGDRAKTVTCFWLNYVVFYPVLGRIKHVVFFPNKLRSLFIVYVFVSCFRTLVVIVVSDSYWFLYCAFRAHVRCKRFTNTFLHYITLSFSHSQYLTISVRVGHDRCQYGRCRSESWQNHSPRPQTRRWGIWDVGYLAAKNNRSALYTSRLEQQT